MKRKPREPEQHYWLDLPTREPLSFCQANFASASLPHTPDPTSPSLLLSDVFCFWGMAVVTWFSGWEPTELLPWSLGSSWCHVLQREPFPSWNSCFSLLTAQWDSFTAPAVGLCWRKAEAGLPAILIVCLHPGRAGSGNWVFFQVPSSPAHSGILWPTAPWWHCTCPVLSNMQTPVLPPPLTASVRTEKCNSATTLVFISVQDTEKMLKICLK